jgi:hypothetical protein
LTAPHRAHRDWLASQQQPDGSWKPDTNFINEGATNRYNSDVAAHHRLHRLVARQHRLPGPAVEKAKQFIESHIEPKPDAYTLAVIANFAADYGKDREFTRRAMQALLDARTEKDDQVSWNAEETGVYSTGESAAIETTGLATQALLKWGRPRDRPQGAQLHLLKEAGLRQLGHHAGHHHGPARSGLATELSASDVRGTSSTVTLDGKPVETLNSPRRTTTCFHQFVFKGIDAASPHPSSSTSKAPAHSPTRLSAATSRRGKKNRHRTALHRRRLRPHHLAQNDIATATATIRNNLPKTANMVMVDLGIPPGFDLLSEDLQSMQEKTAGAEERPPGEVLASPPPRPSSTSTRSHPKQTVT